MHATFPDSECASLLAHAEPPSPQGRRFGQRRRRRLARSGAPCGAGRTLKNPGSQRMVPLHPALIAEGFVDYVRGLPATGPLFPQLSLGADGTRASARHARWVRELGITARFTAPAHALRLAPGAAVHLSLHPQSGRRAHLGQPLSPKVVIQRLWLRGSSLGTGETHRASNIRVAAPRVGVPPRTRVAASRHPVPAPGRG